MPKDFSQLSISMPDFGDAEKFLKSLGLVVVDGIIDMIDDELRPDGTAQKQNSPAYREMKRIKKGYTKPLWGIENPEDGKKAKDSPYMARRSRIGFLRTFLPPDRLVIHLNNVMRMSGKTMAEVGIELTKKGYWFMGITAGAELGIRKRAEQYFQGKVRKMMGK